MGVGSVSSVTPQTVGGTQSVDVVRKSFNQLGSALESGNQSDAASALRQLKQNLPAQGGQSSSVMDEKMSKLESAVNSGDMESAKSAYAEIKSAMAQGPGGAGSAPQASAAASGSSKASGGAQGGGGSAHMSVSAQGTAISSSGGSSAGSTKSYDKKDANKDGTVTAMEELTYYAKHPEAQEEEPSQSAETGTKLNLSA